MCEDMVLATVLACCRLPLLPVQWLFRRGVWQGLRRLGYGAFLVVFLGDLHGAGWNPVVLVGEASQAQLALLIGLMFLTGGLMFFGPAPAKPQTHGSAGWASCRGCSPAGGAPWPPAPWPWRRMAASASSCCRRNGQRTTR